jgi:hypothetical protein
VDVLYRFSQVSGDFKNFKTVDGVTAGTCKKFWDVVPSY